MRLSEVFVLEAGKNVNFKFKDEAEVNMTSIIAIDAAGWMFRDFDPWVGGADKKTAELLENIGEMLVGDELSYLFDDDEREALAKGCELWLKHENGGAPPPGSLPFDRNQARGKSATVTALIHRLRAV